MRVVFNSRGVAKFMVFSLTVALTFSGCIGGSAGTGAIKRATQPRDEVPGKRVFGMPSSLREAGDNEGMQKGAQHCAHGQVPGKCNCTK